VGGYQYYKWNSNKQLNSKAKNDLIKQRNDQRA
jgi:hypothetical protein